MWLGKFLDFEDDIKELKSKIKKDMFDSLGKSKLTPLEFTIIETIFNSTTIRAVRKLFSYLKATFTTPHLEFGSRRNII